MAYPNGVQGAEGILVGKILDGDVLGHGLPLDAILDILEAILGVPDGPEALDGVADLVLDTLDGLATVLPLRAIPVGVTLLAASPALSIADGDGWMWALDAVLVLSSTVRALLRSAPVLTLVILSRCSTFAPSQSFDGREQVLQRVDRAEVRLIIVGARLLRRAAVSTVNLVDG